MIVTELLEPLVTDEWAERYGRPVSLCSQPRHPVSRLTQAGGDARALLATVATDAPNRIAVPALEALRQILVQQLTVAVRGRLRPRTGKDGFPPGSLQIRSPYDLDTCATFDDMEGQRLFVPHYPPHSMRHTCASWLVQKGVSLYEVQHLLGRESFQTAQRYAHLQRDAHKPSSTPGSAWRLPWPLLRSGEAGFVMVGGDVLAAVTVLRGLDPSAVGEGKA